ncbi:Rprd1b [Scenedesmus sp. PABB004]|nr:Rprd1b [Scenedesmus sp. PABB004]
MQVPREGLELKLQRLSQSQQSIESVSSFCCFYIKDACGVVAVWDAEFYKAPADRKLALLYLANHVLQEARKKGSAFQEEFFRVLPKAAAAIAGGGDDKARKAVLRLVAVWEERRVFGGRQIRAFKEALGLPAGGGGSGGGSGGSGGGDRAAKPGGGAAKLGPAGDALAAVLAKAAAATARGSEFAGSWSQGLLTSAGIPEVTSAHSKLQAYSVALQEELAARRAAQDALQAELAKQTAEAARVESQLAAAAGQKQQLDARLSVLTTQAMASLGHMFQQQQQQQNGGAAAAAPPAVPAPAAAGAEAGGSPQAPALEDDDEAPTPADGGAQLAQQPADLQALLANPALLQAIAGGAAAALTAAPAEQAPAQLQVGADGLLGFPPAGGFGADAFLQQPGGFGGGLVGQHSGFADEADDPYNPEHD